MGHERVRHKESRHVLHGRLSDTRLLRWVISRTSMVRTHWSFRIMVRVKSLNSPLSTPSGRQCRMLGTDRMTPVENSQSSRRLDLSLAHLCVIERQYTGPRVLHSAHHILLQPFQPIMDGLLTITAYRKDEAASPHQPAKTAQGVWG